MSEKMFFLFGSVALLFMLFSNKTKAQSGGGKPENESYQTGVKRTKFFYEIVLHYVKQFFTMFDSEKQKLIAKRYIAMIYKESTGRNWVKGDSGQSYGLGQIYKPTFEDINIRYFQGKHSHIDILDTSGVNTDKARLNINFGVAVLFDKYNSYAKNKKDFGEKLDIMTKRYNGSGTMAENYLQSVKQIERDIWKIN